MINHVSLWHVTPVRIGTEFFNPTTSILEANESLYALVNGKEAVSKNRYTTGDYLAIKRMRDFLEGIKKGLSSEQFAGVSFCDTFPGINGCISKFQLSEMMYCYIMYNGTAVFLDYGKEIPYKDEAYFSIPVFLERQKYEDDYCVNKDVSRQKKPLYDFLHLMWKCMGKYSKHFSSSNDFRNNGISYTLCMTMIDTPDLVSNKLHSGFVKNVNALLDTTPFNNIYDQSQWNLIERRIEEYDDSPHKIKELSENLIFADSWSGVVVAGDLTRNRTCITWLMEFEIVLQSTWLLFDAYCEDILRQELSTLELQSTLSNVEFMKVSLDNDISSNMEQSRHVMRNSLIDSSDINVIYARMHGMLENRLKLQTILEEKKKSKYSLFSDIALLFIALMEIYGVIVGFLSENLVREDYIAMGIISVMAVVLIWAMVKGRN